MNKLFICILFSTLSLSILKHLYIFAIRYNKILYPSEFKLLVISYTSKIIINKLKILFLINSLSYFI